MEFESLGTILDQPKLAGYGADHDACAKSPRSLIFRAGVVRRQRSTYVRW
jgi:hypothetical protein